MPHRLLSLDEVAEYLHLTRDDIEDRVRNHEMPFEKRGDRMVFRKREIDQWASQRILSLAERRLEIYHEKSTFGTSKVLDGQAILPTMLRAGALDSAMTSKTKASVLRDLAALAGKTGQVCDPTGLLESIEAREKLCSTALPGGLALPHPSYHDPYMFESSFLVVGRPIQEIHFGASDGRPTTLFILICCQDDRYHLHTLARLCWIAQKTRVLDELRDAPDAMTMRDALIAAELAVLGAK
jgi:excisionase family DNA binding protein